MGIRGAHQNGRLCQDFNAIICLCKEINTIHRSLAQECQRWQRHICDFEKRFVQLTLRRILKPPCFVNLGRCQGMVFAAEVDIILYTIL